MDPVLLQQAFTHSSYTDEHAGTPHNGRLEWLGDAVLQLVVSHHLYTQHPDADEAELTRLRSAMVCDEQLAALLSDRDLGSVRACARERDTTAHSRMLAGVYEALVGAAYVSFVSRRA